MYRNMHELAFKKICVYEFNVSLVRMLKSVDKLYKSCSLKDFCLQIPLPFFLSSLDPFRPVVPVAPRGPSRLFRHANRPDLENYKQQNKTIIIYYRI